MTLQGKDHTPLYIFIGPPGSGKGTLAQICRDRLSYKVLSTGNICRKHISDKTPLGLQLEAITKSGQLAPDDLVFAMVEEWLADSIKMSSGIILDGFPRTIAQAHLLQKYVHEKGLADSVKIVNFEIAADVLVFRMQNRLTCGNKACQAVYNAVTSPPKQEGICDKCNGFVSVRADDRADVITKRLDLYEKHKKDMFAFYEKTSVPIITLHVDDSSPEDVYSSFLRAAHLEMKSVGQ
jgi:adenylate kinase